MTVTVTYRNGAFHPDEPLDLPEGTSAKIVVDTTAPSTDERLDEAGDGRLDDEPEASAAGDYAWLKTLMDADLDLPTDFSENHDEYLTGRMLHKGRRLDGKELG